MIILGLTGSIGMGKSGAARMLRKLGVPTHDSDHAVHKALLPRGEAFEEVAVTFRDAWDSKKRIIDRSKLGEIVFNDAKKRKILESILHPVAQKSQEHFIRAMRRQGKKIVALEIPLLFETGAEKRLDFTICVTAPATIQRRRVLRRKNMTAEKFEKILQFQMPDAQKRMRSDFVVQTGMGYAYTHRELQNILRMIKGKHHVA